uniref:Uncharacterized protein n=1 Tax=Phaeomonas parva TaxID=124430 RepID=A0A6U4J8R7_9STRA
MAMMRRLTFVLLAWVLLMGLARAEDDHDDEEHHGEFEYLAIYHVEHHDHHEEEDDHHDDRRRMLSMVRRLEGDDHEDEIATSLALFQNDHGSFSDDYMLFGCIEVADASDDTLHEAEEWADEWYHEYEEGEVTAPVVENFGELDCSSETSAYNLSLNSAEGYGFHALVHFAEEGHYAIFTGHLPEEFTTEDEFPMLSYTDGDALEPEIVLGEDDDDDDTDWGLPILASFVSGLPSLVGILFLIPFFKQMADHTEFMASMNSFASGVLLAAAVFLILPEGYLLAGSGEEEADAAGLWGSMICLAFFVSFALKFGFAAMGGDMVHVPDDEKKGYAKATSDVESKESTTDGQPRGVCDSSKWTPTGFFLTVGDFLHNFSDGILIAAAFDGCGTTFGWEITAITVAHELPQEISDFGAMVTSGGCTYLQGILANFGGSLSSILGAVIYLASDPDNQATGMALAFGGGMYLFVAAAELPEIMTRGVDSFAGAFLRLALFALGTIAIGLILLDHEHCEPDDGSGGGHAH